jgi:uncharacterized membrane protein AbrB (regulator of aidB expression)
MSELSKKSEFHISSIKNLAFVALVTIVSMITTRFLLAYYISPYLKTPEYTSSKSYISLESPSE